MQKKKKKDTTHIYVKDHKEVFIMCSILFKNKKFLYNVVLVQV